MLTFCFVLLGTNASERSHIHIQTNRAKKTAMASVRTMAATVGAVAASSAALRLLGPSFAEFVATLGAWLAPPYLYLLINAIILSIAASSRFQKLPRSPDADVGAASVLPHPSELPAADLMIVPLYVPPAEFEAKLVQNVATSAELYEEVKPAPDDRAEEYGDAAPVKVETENQLVVVEEPAISTLEVGTPERSDSVGIPPGGTPPAAEKPLVSARFSGQRKARKSSIDGKEALRRVAQPRRNETLESTWRAITEGRAVPLARHLKRSDSTLAADARVHRRDGGNDDDEYPSAGAASLAPRKCETFNDRSTGAGGRSPRGTASGAGSSGRRISMILRREPSPGLEELNRRVEAFIKKFNEEMRLQRQESFKQYMDMINRGT